MTALVPNLERMSTEAALELDVTATSNVAVDVHFAGFPGLWVPGRPIAIRYLDFASADEALAKVQELGLPLNVVEVESGSAAMPERDNHVADEEQARAIDLGSSGGALKTHAQLDEAAQAAGVEWPLAKMTVAEKTEFLHSFEQGTVDADGSAEGEG